MIVKRAINLLLRAFGSRRREGHTSIMMNGAATTPKATVITANLQQANDLRTSYPGIRVISLAQIESLTGDHGPIVIDHYALQSLLQAAAATITDRENKLRQARLDILKIAESIQTFLTDEA